MQLRPATIDDAPLLLTWRNDPVTRANSVHCEVVALADHLRWFAATLQNPKRKLLIAEDGGVSVGTIRIDVIDGESQELSWTVAPEARGKGVGKAMVALAIASLRGTIAAVIKATNTASLRIAERLGFVLHHERGNILEYRLQKE